MLQTLNQLDTRLSEKFCLQKKHPLWWPAVILAHSGDSWLWAAGVGLVWLAYLGGAETHRFAALLEISIVFQALFVFALKTVIKRRRPAGEWGGFYRQYDPHSFPSGHATRAVLLAVLAASLGPTWFAWVMIVWAPLVCISRVLTGVHYLSDILGGMLLGLLMGLALAALSPLLQQLLPILFS
jgi:undecaprenyl-diphosphatase